MSWVMSNCISLLFNAESTYVHPHAKHLIRLLLHGKSANSTPSGTRATCDQGSMQLSLLLSQPCQGCTHKSASGMRFLPTWKTLVCFKPSGYPRQVPGTVGKINDPSGSAREDSLDTMTWSLEELGKNPWSYSNNDGFFPTIPSFLVSLSNLS